MLMYNGRAISASRCMLGVSEADLENLRDALEGFIELHWLEPQSKTIVAKHFLQRWKQLRLERN